MSNVKLPWFACAALSLPAWQVAWAQPPPKPDAPEAKVGVAAYVAGEPITMQDVDAKALKTDMALAQSLYDARRTALDQIVMERLLASEAAAKGIAIDQFIRDRIAEKAKPVTDADIEAFYNTNRARMSNRTLEQVSADIRKYLTTQNENEARGDLLRELKEKAQVRITLQPPRVDVTVAANDPVKGPADAKVTIVEFSEFQ